MTLRSSLPRYPLRAVKSPRAHDLLCFSHLRWDFVYQRPQHLMSRAAENRRVFFIEEPHYDVRQPAMETRCERGGITIAIPHLPATGSEAPGREAIIQMQMLLDFFLSAQRIADFVAWYYTPMAYHFSAHLYPVVTVYDCMDELSAFAGAPAGIQHAERSLLSRADLVLTGGRSLYEAKQSLHPNVHEFPSSVDVAHFARARNGATEPADQREIPRPRIGFFGVIDERLDRQLLADVAAATPGWHYVLVGPIVKIDRRSLPTAPNIHYLGQKGYADLPDYISGWDVAMLPFARNEATRYISPTKTPEYLAAGRPVVSTSIADVVRPYRDEGLARIADTPDDFVVAIREALCDPPARWLPRADAFLAGRSWDSTWTAIDEQIRAAMRVRGERFGRGRTAGGEEPLAPPTRPRR